jgi:hypothetical protein
MQTTKADASPQQAAICSAMRIGFLAAALKTFMEKGYAGTTTLEIANISGPKFESGISMRILEASRRSSSPASGLTSVSWSVERLGLGQPAVTAARKRAVAMDTPAHPIDPDVSRCWVLGCGSCRTVPPRDRGNIATAPPIRRIAYQSDDLVAGKKVKRDEAQVVRALCCVRNDDRDRG